MQYPLTNNWYDKTERFGKFMNKYKCGIVILNTNDGERTDRLVSSIKGYHSLSRIVIVDNCSKDNSYEILKRHRSPKIDIVQTDVNKGYSYGNNVGIKKLLAYNDVDIIGIANTDVEFGEELVRKILEDFEANEQYGVLAGLQLAPGGKESSHPFWGCKATVRDFLLRRIGQLFIIGRVFHINPDTHYIKEQLNNNETIFQVGAVEGSLFFIRTELFKTMGLFDDNVFLYWEEDIISNKILKTKYCVCVDPTVSYIHYGGQTTKKLFSNIKKVKLANKSSSYYLKTFISNNVLIILLNCIISELIVFEVYLMTLGGKLIRRIGKKREE